MGARTRLYLLDLDLTNRDEAIKKISLKESLILQLSSQNDDLIRKMKPKETNERSTTKWYPRHKIASHDKSECFTERRHKDLPRGNKNSQNKDFLEQKGLKKEIQIIFCQNLLQN